MAKKDQKEQSVLAKVVALVSNVKHGFFGGKIGDFVLLKKGETYEMPQADADHLAALGHVTIVEAGKEAASEAKVEEKKDDEEAQA